MSAIDPTILQAAHDALASQLLDVQADCIAERQRALRVEAVLDDHDAIEDFALDLSDASADRRVLDQCHCAHCDESDGICPMAVQQLVGDHLRALRDRVWDALAQPDDGSA